MKYFLLGAFSSGILLYGMSLLYGLAGSTNLGQIGQEVGSVLGLIKANPTGDIAKLRPMLLLGMIALAAGLFFKVAAVPFYFLAAGCFRRGAPATLPFPSPASKTSRPAALTSIFSSSLPVID